MARVTQIENVPLELRHVMPRAWRTIPVAVFESTAAMRSGDSSETGAQADAVAVAAGAGAAFGDQPPDRVDLQ